EKGLSGHVHGLNFLNRTCSLMHPRVSPLLLSRVAPSSSVEMTKWQGVGYIPAIRTWRFERYSKWPVAADGNSMSVAFMGKVVPKGLMLGAAIVPKCDRVGLPPEAHAELRRFDMLVKHLQDGIAFGLLEAGDAHGE